MATYSDYLQQAGAGGLMRPVTGVWVRVVNNVSSTAYVSTAITDATGLYTVNAVPAGSYTVYTGPTNAGAWTATGDANYTVPVSVGDDIAAKSLTTLASGPYTAVLPGNAAVPTPSGVGTGKLWDWGGGVFNVMAAGCAGDGVTNDTADVALAYAAVTAHSLPGKVVFPPGYAFAIGPTTIPSGSVTEAYGANIKLKAGAAQSLVNFGDVVHTETTILGGTWDGNGTNQTSASNTAVINGGGAGSVRSHVRTRLQDMTILNPAQHGIWLSENVYTTNPKWVTNCACNQSGLQVTGFAFYGDYCKNLVWNACWAFCQAGFDNYELGHLGLQTVIGCTSISTSAGATGINFPFADESRIVNNLVINGTIQNDGNTANQVLIQGNTVLNAAPGNGYSGINAAGAKAIIKGNRVQITGGVSNSNGIGCNSQSLSDSVIEGNVAETLAAVATGAAYQAGYGANSTGNIITGNVAFGKWDGGVLVVWANTTVIGNVLDLTAATATYGIKIEPFGASGTLASNFTVTGNQVLGAPTNPFQFTQGAVLGGLCRDNFGINPIGVVASPAISASLATNNTGVDCMVFISTGATNNVPVVSVNGVTTGQVVPISSTGILVGTIAARGTIQLTGATTTGTTWKWVGAA